MCVLPKGIEFLWKIRYKGMNRCQCGKQDGTA